MVMKELRLRPKANYFEEADWEELYVLGEHWKSDLEFYNDELTFLNHLIGKYFVWLIKDDHIQQVEKTSAKLSKLQQRRTDISQLINKHLAHIEGFIENPFTHNEQDFRKEHQKLEDNIVSFVKDFKTLKKEIFSITEKVLEAEKLNHLISND